MKKLLSTSLLIGSLFLTGCVSIPKETVQLSEVTGQQVAELHKSHIGFVELYYDKLRDDVNDFIDNEWTPLFLSKAVNNKAFRLQLDRSYVISNIKQSDLDVSYKGKMLVEPQKSAITDGVKHAVSKESAKLGNTLIDWSEEAQFYINRKRLELLAPVNEQEKIVLKEINSAYLDLQRSQSTIMGYLSSAVKVKQESNEVLKKLGALEKVNKVMDEVTNSNNKLSAILRTKNGGDKVKDFIKQIEESYKKIKNINNKND